MVKTVRLVHDSISNNKYYVYSDAQNLQHIAEEEPVPADIIVGVAYPVMEDMMTQDITIIAGNIATMQNLEKDLVEEFKQCNKEIAERMGNRIGNVISRIASKKIIFFGLDTVLAKTKMLRLIEQGIEGYIDVHSMDLERLLFEFGTKDIKNIEDRYKNSHHPGKFIYTFETPLLEKEFREKDSYDVMSVLFKDMREMNKNCSYTDFKNFEQIFSKWKAILKTYRESTTKAFLGTADEDYQDKEEWPNTTLYQAIEAKFKEVGV